MSNKIKVDPYKRSKPSEKPAEKYPKPGPKPVPVKEHERSKPKK